MKNKFSTHWLSSVQPRKQRKYLAEAPLHIKRKILSANLSKELRKIHGKRSIEVRKGDEVKIMRGKFSKKQGKISSINRKKMKLAIEGIQIQKKDGTKVNVWLHASKLQVISLLLDDKRRIKNKTKGVVENAHNKK